ncbi:hypothetical protein [Kineosporia sp. R_H_3]|uniref:PGAP1-like alpha/beta domain-containing protein n=1 Tax=Kineosporia sp. R_H_3 TaxID=1961848 RepID=UPI000B4B4226|nr:hypothetical protein [Kineosporia sp. R_H_3]
MSTPAGARGDTAGSLVVRGGAGGVAARTEDMEATARLLLACAADLAGAALTVGRVLGDAGLLVSAPWSPLTFAHAEHVLGGCVAGGAGPTAAATRVGALAAALLTTAAGYAAAEEGARRAAHAVDLAAGAVAGRLGVVLAAATAPQAVEAVALALLLDRAGLLPDGAADGAGVTAAGGPGLPDRVGGLLARGGGATEHLVAAVPGVLEGLLTPVPAVGPVWAAAAGTEWPPRSTPQVSALLLALAGAGGLLGDSARVRARSGRPAPAAAPAGVVDLAGLVRSAYPDGGGAPGSVTVTRLDAPGGARSWVVAVPGTQVWAPRSGENPLDVTSDARSLAGRSSAAEAAVLAAMRSAGVRSGEPVCLVGHSLGGMVAAGLAADPDVRRRYAVREVVTMGSPVAAYRVPPEVGVLALEHGDDLVPRLDGTPNPDRSTWVTVRRDVTAPGALPDVVATHDVDEYVRTAALVDASHDPSIAAARARLAPFLGAPGVTATAVDVTSTRVPG